MTNENFVLVVDDRDSSRYTTVHALKRSGFEVIEAVSGREALEMAKDTPLAILLDVKLPDILGYEVCRRLKANPHTNHIPVLQLSAAFLDNESRVYALESGADAYLTQPVEPNVLVATVKSLIKLHEAESAAKLSAQQWQATFDSLSEGVATIDAQGNIQRCNRAMTLLLSRSYAEIEGAPLDQLLNEAFGFILNSEGQFFPCELSFGSRHFRIGLEPVYLGKDRTGSIFVVADLTDQKLAQRAALLNEQLAATGRITNTIAHEINNPLEAITNLLYLIKGSPTRDENTASFLYAAEEEVERVSRISKQILSFHRESLCPTRLKVSELLTDVLALNNRALAEKSMSAIIGGNMTLCVDGFPAQLRQVFSNIVRNAIEASHEGGKLRIKISRSEIAAGVLGSAVRVIVCDQGVGIPLENLNRIFQAFFTTKELKGTGVGLWLSSSIVQEHRGQIRVRSSTRAGNSGTCISVLLPVESRSVSRN